MTAMHTLAWYDDKVRELLADNARLHERVAELQATSGYEASIAQVENDRLRALLQKLRWKSIDKDNMEFRCEITCYVMDEIRRALVPKP